MKGFINGHAPAVAAGGGTTIDMMEAGFELSTILGGVAIYFLCKLLDFIWGRLTTYFKNKDDKKG